MVLDNSRQSHLTDQSAGKSREQPHEETALGKENWISDLENTFRSTQGKLTTDSIALAQLTKQDRTKAKSAGQETLTEETINKLKDKVLNDEKANDKKDTWQHGLDLRELGVKMIGYARQHHQENQMFPEALQYLDKSAKTLESKLSDQPPEHQKALATMVTQLMLDTGNLLAKPVEKLTQAEGQKQRHQANELFDRALKLAQDNKQPAFRQALILQGKGNNLADRALVDLPPNFTPEQSQAYQKSMETAMSTLKQSLALVDTQEGKIRILNDMTIQESRRIKAPGDVYATQTRSYFNELLETLRKYDPEKAAQTPEQKLQLAEQKDNQMLHALTSYRNLVESEEAKYQEYAKTNEKLTANQIAHRDTLKPEKQKIQTERQEVLNRRSERAKQLQQQQK